MILKKGVKLTDMTPQILLAMMVADQVYTRHGQELVITSVDDSKHGKDSLHPSGNAFDARTFYFTPEVQRKVANEIKARLGESFDVVLEIDHLHIEYDPKYITT